VVVQSSFFTTGAGLAIGSETAGGIRNITFVNNTVDIAAKYAYKVIPFLPVLIGLYVVVRSELKAV